MVSKMSSKPARLLQQLWTKTVQRGVIAALRLFSCDDACPSCNLQARDWNKKYCLTDIELMHGASLQKPLFVRRVPGDDE
jgi:hypothetical protein